MFDGLSFVVNKEDRLSFAGANGTGKSTLMKCIAGVIEANAGRITKPKGYNVGYLPQDGIHLTGHSLWVEAESAFAEAKAARAGVISSVGLERMLDRHEVGGSNPPSPTSIKC